VTDFRKPAEALPPRETLRSSQALSQRAARTLAGRESLWAAQPEAALR
jgi:hypothetical protein